MARKPRKVTDADRTAESAPMSEAAGAKAAAPRRGVKDVMLLEPPKTAVIPSPFGQGYLAQRSRSIAADTVQAIVEWWKFDVGGYNTANSPTPTMPYYDHGEVLLQDWYAYMRDIGKAQLKYKHTPTTITDTDNFKDWMNCCHYAIANLTTLFNLSRLVIYNQAFASLCTYLPKNRGYMSRLWDRMNHVPVPSFLKSHALLCGMVTYKPNGGYAPYVRLWQEANILGELYGISGNYTDQSAVEPSAIFTTEANLNAFLANIEKAVQVAEGRVAAALTPDDTDVIAIRDVIDMLEDLPDYAPIYAKGLPDAKSLPGLTVSPLIESQLFMRGYVVIDTHGVGGDEFNAFPTLSNTTLNGLIPVCGVGAPNPVYDFSLLGSWKACQLNDDTTGLMYTSTANPLIEYGTDYRFATSGDFTDIYTREDGWVNLTMSVDYGDGAAIRGGINLGSQMMKHIYFLPVSFVGQLAANFEYRYLDALDVDYTIWVDGDDLGENWAFFLSEVLKVPYLK